MTNLPRTLIDLASILDDGWLRAAFDSAIRYKRSNIGWISRTLARHGPGRRGIARLRALVDEFFQGDGEVSDSALESLALELANATGRKPQQKYNVVDGRYHVAEVDLAWPELRLCAQLDGWQAHGTREAFVNDRACDRELSRLGWTVLRYTRDEVVHNGEAVIDELIQSFKSRSQALDFSATRRRSR